MPTTQPAYTPEFKQDVLAYHQSNPSESLAKVAVHFGISTVTLRSWKRRAQTPLGAAVPAVSTETPEQELRRLRRENRTLQMRCEILKKTVGIFSCPSSNATS